MQIVTWNIRHGGPAGDKLRHVIETLLGFDADLLVVTEYRSHARGAIIEAALRAAGYHTSHPGAPPAENSVLLASRAPIARAGHLAPDLCWPWLLWSLELPLGLVTGVYMPGMKRKLPYWEAILRAVSGPEAPCLMLGDFNTGRNDLDKADEATPFVGAAYMTRLEAAGYLDLWRSRHADRREYSYYSKPWNNGFRLDHAFATARIAGLVTDCHYDHAPRERGLSDHSALRIVLKDAASTST
jgi:exodeoxyribonuclease-3